MVIWGIEIYPPFYQKSYKKSLTCIVFIRILRYEKKEITMNIKFYTEEYLYPRDIQNVLTRIGVDKNHHVEIINIKSSNNSSLLDLLVEIDGVMEYGIEITQTTDKDSRNSSVYQRPQKFLQFKHYYPNAKCLMYYTEKFVPKTDTAKFGFGILDNMGVELYNVDGVYPTEMNELIRLKNSMKTKKNNVPVRVNINSDYNYFYKL